MTQIRATGRAPMSPAQLGRLRASRAYTGKAEAVETVIQPVARIRDQGSTPSCVLQTAAAAIHALAGFDGSAIGPWIDARRRQGDLLDPTVGTNAETAIESLIHRGIEPYKIGEESRPESDYRQLPDLESELAADDNRISPIAEHFILTGTRATQRLAIVNALKEREAVMWSTGLYDSFFNLKDEQVIEAQDIGSTRNGHEMRIFGYLASIDCFAIQHSWGEGFAGCTINGQHYPGCSLARADAVIDRQWDTMVLQLKSA
jgi:hypothetical protein